MRHAIGTNVRLKYDKGFIAKHQNGVVIEHRDEAPYEQTTDYVRVEWENGDRRGYPSNELKEISK